MATELTSLFLAGAGAAVNVHTAPTHDSLSAPPESREETWAVLRELVGIGLSSGKNTVGRQMSDDGAQQCSSLKHILRV